MKIETLYRIEKTNDDTGYDETEKEFLKRCKTYINSYADEDIFDVQWFSGVYGIEKMIILVKESKKNY